MNLFQIVFIPVLLLAAIASLTIGASKDRSLRNRVLWFCVWALGAAAIAAPDYSTRFAEFLGIGRGTDLIFYISLILGVAVIRYFYLRMKQMEIQLTRLVRSIALVRPEKGPDAIEPDELELK